MLFSEWFDINETAGGSFCPLDRIFYSHGVSKLAGVPTHDTKKLNIAQDQIYTDWL